MENKNKTKILIVEDEQVTALTIQKMLEPNYEVVEIVSSGEEAIKKVEEYKPDLILMDIVLEDKMNGIQAAEVITARFDTPVVYVTAYSDEETLERAKITHPYGYLVKPINSRELFVTIEVSIHNHKMEQKLKESEKRYRDLANLLPLGVFEADSEGKITFVNRKALEISGCTQKDFESGLYVDQLFISEEVGRVKKNFNNVLNLNEEATESNEYVALRKDGTSYSVEIISSPIFREGRCVGVRGVIRDITKRKQEEEMLKKKLMNFRLEEGNIYLTKERYPTFAMEALKDLVKVGYSGKVISRRPLEEFDVDLDNFDYGWLSEIEHENSLPPNIDSIDLDVSNRSVIFIDSLDYLVSKNGFESILEFVQRLREVAYLKKLVIVLSIDPSILETSQLRLLESETVELKPMYPDLPHNATKVLNFIFKQNSRGIKPSHSDISRGLNFTRQTTSRWVKHLVKAGYVREEVYGRNKLIDVTEKGRYFFELSD